MQVYDFCNELHGEHSQAQNCTNFVKPSNWFPYNLKVCRHLIPSKNL